MGGSVIRSSSNGSQTHKIQYKICIRNAYVEYASKREIRNLWIVISGVIAVVIVVVIVIQSLWMNNTWQLDFKNFTTRFFRVLLIVIGVFTYKTFSLDAIVLNWDLGSRTPVYFPTTYRQSWKFASKNVFWRFCRGLWILYWWSIGYISLFQYAYEPGHSGNFPHALFTQSKNPYNEVGTFYCFLPFSFTSSYPSSSSPPSFSIVTIFAFFTFTCCALAFNWLE